MNGVQKVGCGILVLGLAMLAGSVALFGFTIKRVTDSREVATVPIEVGEELTTDLVEVDTDRHCQITFELDIRTDSVQEEEPEFEHEDLEFEARYAFPFRYTVRDAEGNRLHTETGRLSWDHGMRSFSNKDLDSTGGMVTVEHSLDKFRVPSPGRIRVEARLEPDDKYEAEARSARLKVYDNVSRHAGVMAGGVGLMCLAPTMIVVGLIVFIVGIATRQPRRTPHGSDR